MAYKAFAIQTFFCSLGYKIRKKSGVKHHPKFKLNSKLKNLNIDQVPLSLGSSGFPNQPELLSLMIHKFKRNLDV